MIVVVDGEPIRDLLISLDDCSEVSMLALNRLTKTINYLFGPDLTPEEPTEDEALTDAVDAWLGHILATALLHTSIVRTLAFYSNQYVLDIYLEVIDGDF